MPANWPVPQFGYGEHVTITPLEDIPARVVDLHFLGMYGSIEYDVRYFADGKEHKIRVFEDELRHAAHPEHVHGYADEHRSAGAGSVQSRIG